MYVDTPTKGHKDQTSISFLLYSIFRYISAFIMMCFRLLQIILAFLHGMMSRQISMRKARSQYWMQTYNKW